MSLESATEALRRRAAQNPKLGYRVKFALDEGGVILWDGTGDQPVFAPAAKGFLSSGSKGSASSGAFGIESVVVL